jgi:hypothetical protein
MKSPHRQRPDEQARLDTEAFIARYAGQPGTRSVAAAKRRAPARSGAGGTRAARGRAGR